MSRAFFCSLALVFVTACGSGSGGPGADGGDPTSADAAVAPLMCRDLALCTNYKVKTFIGTPGTASGGSITDGLYRLAWEVAPDSSHATDVVGYHDSLTALRIAGGTWVLERVSARGIWSTSGTTLTLMPQVSCQLGKEGDAVSAAAQPYTYGYSAAADRLTLYEHQHWGDNVEYDVALVFLPVANPDALCATVSTEPSSPGDSAQCDVTNCACAYRIGGELASCL